MGATAGRSKVQSAAASCSKRLSERPGALGTPHQCSWVAVTNAHADVPCNAPPAFKHGDEQWRARVHEALCCPAKGCTVSFQFQSNHIAAKRALEVYRLGLRVILHVWAVHDVLVSMQVLRYAWSYMHFPCSAMHSAFDLPLCACVVVMVLAGEQQRARQVPCHGDAAACCGRHSDHAHHAAHPVLIPQ